MFLFAFIQTAGKMNAFNKLYKITCHISSEASESDKLEQDDASEDGDFDALPLPALNAIKIPLKKASLAANKEIHLKTYKTPDTPPPDYI
jgi:hypothetical protein